VNDPIAHNQSEILRSLSELRPYDIDAGKTRIGSEADGGYIVADLLADRGALLSFGVANNCDFERAFACRGYKVVMFDPSIAHPPEGHSNFTFFRKALGPRDEPAAGIVSLATALETGGLGSEQNLILKCDIEGAEIEALGAASEQTLANFSQIVVEIHGLDQLGAKEYRDLFTGFIGKLNRRFTLFHVHANNCAPIGFVGGDRFGDHHQTGGIPVPYVLEASFVRADLVKARPSTTIYPTALDRPNHRLSADHLLYFFPFLPWNAGQMTDLAASPRAASPSTLDRKTAPSRILVDVNTLVFFAAHGDSLTGIQRVELGLARELVKYGDQPVVWDETNGVFRTIDLELVERLLAKEAVPLGSVLGQPTRRPASDAGNVLQLRLLAMLFPFIPPVGPLRRRFARRMTSLFGRHYLDLDVGERLRISQRLGLDRQADRRKLFMTVAQPLPFLGEEIVPDTRDILLLPSALPSERCMNYIQQHKIGIAPLIYDLYVINQPHLVQLADVIGALWRKMLPLYARLSHVVLTCSDNTKQEVVAWFDANNIRAPEIVTVPLAPGLGPGSPALRPENFPFTRESFVLLVGSFGPNKNQAWAHMLWSRLVARIGERALPLVFAGRGSWRAQDTIESIRQDVHYGRHFFIVEAPTDQELAWLYASCAFVIQPSETEGWGLPVSEALAFGKPCLTSGRGALHESAQGLAWEADPVDGERWLARLSELMTDPAQLAAERERTQRAVRVRTWKNVADDIRRVLLG